MKRMVSLFLVLTAVAAGCGSNTRSNDAAATPSPSRCVAIPVALQRDLTDAVHDTRPAVNLVGFGAVRSHDFKRLWFVSAGLAGTGFDPAMDRATWATNRVGRQYGTIFSVDSLAEEISGFGSGENTSANITIADDGAEESRDCVP